MTRLAESYSPQWLYLDEFARALRPEVSLQDDYFSIEPAADTDEAAELKEAIALLVRDRIIVNGQLNETEFRFLEGRPDLRTTAWVAQLSGDDFNWNQSHLTAGVDTSKPRERHHQQTGLLIEIAASALNYFGKPSQPAQRTPPEVTRARGFLQKLYGDRVPPPEEKTLGDMLQEINRHIGKQGRPISKDTLARATGRRKKRK